MNNKQGGNGVNVLPDNQGLGDHATITIKTKQNGKKTFSVWFAVEEVGKSRRYCPHCREKRKKLLLTKTGKKKLLLTKFKLSACCIRSAEEKKVITRKSKFCLPVIAKLKQETNGVACKECGYERERTQRKIAK